jgi:signal transduction histidine kinase
VDHTLFLVQHHGEIKARRLVRMLDAHADEPLLVDRDQLVQVVMAMLWNSTDATPHGAEIRVETVLVPSEAGALALQIVDTGHGMSPAVLARAFEPFFSTKATGKGTGLGLSICYGIVRDHGGRIELESLEGVGTTVRLILPRATSTAATS